MNEALYSLLIIAVMAAINLRSSLCCVSQREQNAKGGGVSGTGAAACDDELSCCVLPALY